MKKVELLLQAKNSIKAKRKELKEQEEFIKLLNRQLPDEISYPISIWGTCLTIHVTSENELHEVRKLYKTIALDYQDKLHGLFHNYGDQVYAMYSYHATNFSLVICWDFTVDTTPQEFIKNGCKWETLSPIYESKAFVCPVKQE